MDSLKKRCLVLNKSWQAVGIISIQRAMVLLCSDKAKIIDGSNNSYQLYTWDDWAKIRPSNEEAVIRSAHSEYRIPEIIILTNYDRIPSPRIHFSRSTIFKRDNFTCQYCGKKVCRETGTIDHIIPKAQGGTTTWTNCILACMGCNSQKADRRPEQAVRTDKHKIWNGPSPMRLLSVPKKPKFALLKCDRDSMPPSWNSFIGDALTA